MKKLVFLLLIVGLQFAISQPIPKKRYKVDLKTKFSDKKDLNPLKKGLKEQIARSGCFENKEFGEDFSLWVLAPDVSREILTDGSKRIIYVCLLEVRTPTAFGSGDFIANRQVRIEYIIDKKELDKLEDPHYINIGEFILNTVENTTKKLGAESSKGMVGVVSSISPHGIMGTLGANIITESCSQLKNLYTPKDKLDYKAEFYIIGKGVYNEFAEMIVELEKK